MSAAVVKFPPRCTEQPEIAFVSKVEPHQIEVNPCLNSTLFSFLLIATEGGRNIMDLIYLLCHVLRFVLSARSPLRKLKRNQILCWFLITYL